MRTRVQEQQVPASRSAHQVALRRATAHADLQLVERVLRKGLRAEQQLLRRLGCVRRTLRHLNRGMGLRVPEAELEDVEQEVLLALWRQLPTYDGRARLETWTYSFCRFELLRSGRRRAAWITRQRELDREPERPEPAPDDELEASLASLAARESRIVRRKHLDGATFVEIAAKERLPLNTVKSRYYRALDHLRDWYGRRLGLP